MSRISRRQCVTALACLATIALAVSCAPETPSAPSPVLRINEVESSGGDPGDWVEIYNPGPLHANLSTYRLLDSDDANVYVIPPGTMLPVGEYLVIEQAEFGFGLGGGDSVRLLEPTGAVADQFTWSTHAATTYGRCPNGVGPFRTTAVPTKGTANECPVLVPNVRINEVESSGGDPGDWVELINTGTTPVDISGFTFSDSDDTHSYAIPAGTILAGGAIHVLDEAAFGFGLGGEDSARLFGLDGALVDSYSWTSHAATTYGRCPDGTGEFTTTTNPTKGSANSCDDDGSGGIRVNEIESSGGDPGDWVELINAGGVAVDVSGWSVLDSDDTNQPSVLADGTILEPGQRLVIDEAELGFGLGGNDAVRLFDESAVLRDSFAWASHAATTYGRCPDGTGDFSTTAAPTKGTANACGSSLTVRVNEVESSGGDPGDWVELVNFGAAPIDLGGFVFKDADDTHAYVIADGTSLGGGEFLVLEEADFGFGLGGADSARLFDPDGVLVDDHAWTSHAATTYARCPDGIGEFETSPEPTKGTSNNC